MKCGACKGRGYHKPLRGVEMVDCQKCGGTGDFEHKAALGSSSVSLGTPPRGALCLFCLKRPAVEYHHACPQNRIDNYLPEPEAQEAKADIRNGVQSCRPCHDAVEGNPQLLEPRHLQPNFTDFLLEWDLFAALPRHLVDHFTAEATT